jgi:hypothetical protein
MSNLLLEDIEYKIEKTSLGEVASVSLPEWPGFRRIHVHKDTLRWFANISKTVIRAASRWRSLRRTSTNRITSGTYRFVQTLNCRAGLSITNELAIVATELLEHEGLNVHLVPEDPA